MTQILRIETARGGEQTSVPFLWTAGARSGGGRVITSLAKVEPSVLQLKRGTRQISPISESRVQESWVAFCKSGNRSTQRETTRLTDYFRFAAELERKRDHSDTVYLVEQVEDEAEPKRAVIYSGSIAPIDHEVVGRDMDSTTAMFVITVERDIEWEHGEFKVTRSGGEEVGNHGGTLILPQQFQSRGVDSRMSTFIVQPKAQGYLKKMWMGIKPNRDGFTSFDPQIAVGSTTNLSSVFIMNGATSYEADSAYSSGAKIRCDYTDDIWAIRFRAPMDQWNSTTSASESNRTYYRGEYHVLMRYRTSNHTDAKYGVRLGTGWTASNVGESISWSDRLYLDPAISPSDGGVEHRYVDLGVINIGGGFMSPEVLDRVVLGSFNLFVDSARVQGDRGSMGFDDMFLVPADRFLHFDLNKEVGPERRVEFYTNAKGVTNGYVVEATGQDAIGKPLSSPRLIISSIPDLVVNNWSIPRESASVLVTVGDRDDYHTKALGSSNRVDIAAKLRTEAFAVPIGLS